MFWLVTGGCGFIGRSLIQRILNNSLGKVRVIDNLSSGSLEDLEKITNVHRANIDSLGTSNCMVELVVGDIEDEKLAMEVMVGVDIVVHLAANTGVAPSVDNPRKDLYSNVIGTFNFLTAAKENKVRRFIFASSGAPLGEVEPPIHEELAAHPVSPYGASKLCGEAYCSAFYKTYGLDTICLRFGNVYGPKSSQKDSVVARFIKRALAGEPWEIYGDGNQTRDFIFIEDLVDAITLASAKFGVGGEVFQIATSKETTVLELAQALNKVLVSLGELEAKIQMTKKRLGDVERNFSDTSKAKTILNWKASTSLKVGLQATVADFITQRNNL